MSNTITLPGGIVLQLPQFPQGQGFNLPGMQLPNQQVPLLNPPIAIPNLSAGAPPDLSGLATQLAPILGPMISSAVPGIGPFLPIIGAVLHILYALVTQVHAANASGTPNQPLQLVHDAAWEQVLAAFGQKQGTTAA